MADDGSSGIGILGVIVGAALVVVVALFLFGMPTTGGGSKNVTIDVRPPVTSTN